MSWLGIARPAVATDRRDVDVAIIGAGAAGIAAGRVLREHKRSFVMLEASDRIGGRVRTDTSLFGVPYDLGAHWIHAAPGLALLDLARLNGFDPYPATTDETVMLAGREANGIEYRDYERTYDAFEAAIIAAGAAGTDVAAASVLPEGHPAWRALVSFILGPYGCGKDLAAVSTLDFARSEERTDYYVKDGYGAFIASLAADLPIALSTPVLAIDHGDSDRITLTTERGSVRARRVLITASTHVIASGLMRFTPDLPPVYSEAAHGLSLGHYNHVALELPGNPLGVERDAQILVRTTGTAQLGFLANVAGSDLCLADPGGSFAADLEAAGEAAAVAAATDLLVEAFGSQIRSRIRRTHATAWGRAPYVGGAFSCAAPGQADARAALAMPHDHRLWFAGEATSRVLWGTVGGAWSEGERAAKAIVTTL
jgi:monoamine oxidase